MRGARDARVVVADRLLADRPQLVVAEPGVALDDRAQVVLDRELVLGRRRHDLRVQDRPVGVDPVAVVEQAPRRLADAVADAGHRLHRDEGGIRLLVRLDQAQGLVARVDELDAAHDDAAEGVAARRLHARLARRLQRERRERGAVECVARERAAEVGAAVAPARVERVRALDVLLDEVLVVLGGADVQATVGDDPPPLDRVRPRLGERDELALDGALGEVEPSRPAHGLERGLPCPLQRVDERPQLPPRRRPVEAADADVDRVDLAAADQREHLVARLLQRQPPLDGRRLVPGELDGAVVAEEVGRVEHVDVERVALDPLSAVEDAAERPERPGQLDAADVLDRVDRARLVRDRADAADAGGDVRRLEARAAAEQRLEEARRLEDPQLDVLDRVAPQPHRHRALALDACEVVRLDRAPLSHRSTPPGTPARRR